MPSRSDCTAGYLAIPTGRLRSGVRGWATGAGADVMKRIAAPMVGGLSTSFLLELLVYPAIYATWKSRFVLRSGTNLAASSTSTTSP